MAILKKRNNQTDARLLLEADEPVELPAAEVDAAAIVVQFETMRPHVAELVETLRAGTVAQLVPVMLDGATFAIHGPTRTFWVKLWHSSAEHTRVERAQVLSCLPSTRGVQIVVGGPGMDDEEDDYDDDGDYDDDEGTDETNHSALPDPDARKD